MNPKRRSPNPDPPEQGPPVGGQGLLSGGTEDSADRCFTCVGSYFRGRGAGGGGGGRGGHDIDQGSWPP